jgi:hypothetical protein
MSKAELFAEGEEPLRHLPVEPWVIAAAILAVLMLLVIGVLLFGKGRPHS